MATEMLDIERGMEVYDPDGERIGTVSHIWTGFNGGPAAQGNYFRLDEGGFLGLGEKEAYIPFSAVEMVVPGECVTVNCPKEDCMILYATKPNFLDQRG